MRGTVSSSTAGTGIGAFAVFSSVSTELYFKVTLETSSHTVPPGDGGGAWYASQGTDQQNIRVPNVRFLPPKDDRFFSLGIEAGLISYTRGIQRPSQP
jgi:hypothetical protein